MMHWVISVWKRRGKIIHYLVNNPSAVASYEVLNDELRRLWLHTVVDG